MTATVTISQFARLTHLSVKTLRAYHEIGLLPQASVDPSSGYRRYATAQVETALLIRRLRRLPNTLTGGPGVGRDGGRQQARGDAADPPRADGEGARAHP